MKKLAGAVNYRYLLSLLLSILFAFLIGAGILAVSGFHPLEAYGAMLSGAFDSARHIGDFLEYAMVLCVCGLACVLGARVGIFNVGGEGQLLLGAIFAAQVGVWMDGQPRFLVIVCAALAAMAVGGLYAFLPGVLKVKVKVNEVITTIMLNTIAAYLCQYLAKGPWKNANKNMVAATEQLGAQYWFGNVIPRSNLTSAVFAAAVMAFLVWYVMERTSVGYEMRITGENPRFAFFSGLRTDQIVLLSMVVSGAMCGLVGMFRVYGVEHLYRDSVSKDYYFEALMVAMIAQYKPVTVILLSLFFAVLKIGAQGMELIGIPSQIYLIIQTVIIFCMAAESGITRSLTAAHERRRAKRAAEERLTAQLNHVPPSRHPPHNFPPRHIYREAPPPPPGGARRHRRLAHRARRHHEHRHGWHDPHGRVLRRVRQLSLYLRLGRRGTGASYGAARRPVLRALRREVPLG